MSQMIQALERRMLMSVTAANLTADVSNVRTDAAAVLTAHTARVTAAKEGYDAIVANLKVLDLNASKAVKLESVRQSERLAADDLISHARIVADMTAFLATAKLDASIAGAHGKSLLLHPTSTALQKLVANDITNLNTKIPAKLTTLQNELTNANTTIDVDANIISAANPSIASVISTVEGNIASASATLSAAAEQVATATSQLATDLAAIPT